MAKRANKRSVRRSRRSGRSLRGGGLAFKDPVLDELVKLGISGMIAMYVATILVSVPVVSSVAGSIAPIIGLSKGQILSAAKATGVAGVAVKLHKNLSK